MNIVSYLDEHAEKIPDKIALSMRLNNKTEMITFRELHEKSATFASAMKKIGLKPKDRVILMIPMSIELYVAMLGLIRMGAVVIFIDPWIKLRQIAAFATFSEAKAFIGIGKSHILRLLDKRLFKLPITVTTTNSFCGFPAKYSYNKIMGNAKADYSIFDCSVEDSALITFTSGSSGLPKGANRTHGFLNAQHKALQSEFSYNDNDVDMPMFPVFALNNLARGITSVIPDIDFKNISNIAVDKIIDQINEFKVTTATASPPFFLQLANSKEVKNMNLRRILTGGAAISASELKILRKAWEISDIQVVYGSTEAEPVAHLTLEERLEIEEKNFKGYCIGKPIEKLKTAVIAITKEDVKWNQSYKSLALPQGEVGELIVSGDHVCNSYFKNDEAVKSNKIIDNENQLWHRMGDTGYFDENGYFHLVGRVHSTIFCKSGLVHAQLIEKKVQNFLSVRTALLALPAENGFEKSVLIVTGNEDYEIKQKLLAISEIDEVIFITKAFPLDPRHKSKVDYIKLKEMIMEGKI
ncbi:AMP-binding protein [Lentisphaerota bacterium WC36G]|nr:AMP-binding protein [Lentisphaerae bacterium WC36]